MSAEDQRFIAAARLNRFLLASIARKPGEVMDATDEKLYQRTLRPLYAGIRDGKLSADFERTPEGSDVPSGSCSGEVWQVIFFIRNSEFRPTFEALEKKISTILKLSLPSPYEAAEVVTAPQNYVQRSSAPAIAGSVMERAIAGSGPAPFIDPAAEWVTRFSREIAGGDDDKDAGLLRIMARMGSDQVRHRAMDGILGQREADRTAHEARAEGKQESQGDRRVEADSVRQTLAHVRKLQADAKKETDTKPEGDTTT